MPITEYAESRNVQPRRPPPTLPTLFGRLTTAFSGHDHLHPVVERLWRMCAVLQAKRSVPLDSGLSPDMLIPELLSSLMRHFHGEESDAHFGVLAADRPAFTNTIAELKAEHLAMLDTLRELGALAADERRWHEIVTPLSRLIRRLQAHELRETALLQEYFQE